MKLTKTKNTIATTALILTLTFAATLVALPVVNAADVQPKAFLAVNPNPVGVNQQVAVTIWLQPIPPTPADVFHGFMVTITKPDGTTETRGPLTSSLIGSQYFVFTPTQVGTYYLEFTYPGETFESTGDYYKSATSPRQELTVQEEPIEPWPAAELPTDFWERPISAENREWWRISGNWLIRSYNCTYARFDSASGFNPYSQAPRSAHIAWTKEIALGGLVGGEYGSTSYYTGLSYEWKLDPPIIMNGRLYYNLYPWDIFYWLYTRDPVRLTGFACVDLRTGEELWRNTNSTIQSGQLYNYVSGNQMGVTPLLWNIYGTSQWEVFNAFTGELIARFANATPIFGFWLNNVVYGDDGTMYVYFFDGVNGRFAMWNSTKAFEENDIFLYWGTDVGVFRLREGTYDWRKGIEWNKTIPHLPYASYVAGFAGDVMLVFAGPTYTVTEVEAGYSITTGEQLWAINRTVLSPIRALGEGIYVDSDPTTMRWIGYDLNTGLEKWVSDPMEYPWGSYASENPVITYGKLYVGGYDGYVHAFDINTGKRVWKFYSGNAGLETPCGTYPFWNGPIIADGVVFFGTGEHSPTQPLIRGEKLFAIDAETGEEIWNISGLMNLGAIADGYLIAYNAYDNRIYTFGKGPSATTVTAPEAVQPLGTPVLLKGTVTDQSPGAKDTPAISDEDMSAWMEYLYMQKPMPKDATGVKVKLTAIDPNGNYQDIGTVTADAHGNFGMSWVPPVSGTYYILAEFEGSESYGSSSATTYFVVDPAPSPATPIEPEPAAPLISTEGAILAVVAVAAVIGIAAYWILRKQRK